MTIGEKIKELRKKHNITQEKLAEQLNVSYQAVSKWENNVANPDFSLIVPLAKLFKVTTDELLCFDLSEVEVRKKELLEAYEATWQTGNLDKRLELCINAVRDYPDDMAWMKRLAMAYDMHCYSYEDDERYHAERAKAIQCYENVIKNTKDVKLREDAIAAIVQCLSYVGRKDEAKKYALLYPEEKRDEIAEYYLTGDEQTKHKQKLIMKAYNNLLLKFNILNDYQLQIMAELTKLFFSDENYLDKHGIMFRHEISLAKKELHSNNLHNALLHLKKAKHHAIEGDKIEFDVPGEYQYTSPLFDRLTVDTSKFIHTNDIPHLQLFTEILNKKEFDAIRSIPEFQKLYTE